jgi:hypothetical protein
MTVVPSGVSASQEAETHPPRASLGRKYLSSTIPKVVNNSSYNLGLIMLSSLVIMGSG